MTPDEETALGRRLVESGERPLDMLPMLAIGRYRDHMRERVRRYGCCGHTDEAWVSPMGLVCCMHTREPCPQQRLRAIIETWSIINGGANDNGVIKSRRRRRANHARRN
jgi:hypothetical protein